MQLVSTRATLAVFIFALLAGCGVTGSNTDAYVASSGLPDKAELHHVPFFSEASQHYRPSSLASVLVESGVGTQPQLLVPLCVHPWAPRRAAG